MLATAKKEHEWREVAEILWSLGVEVEGGRKLDNFSEVITSLGLSPAIRKKLVSKGLLQLRSRQPETFFMPGANFRGYGLTPNQAKLPDQIKLTLTGEDKKQPGLGLETRFVDVCPGVKPNGKKIALLIDWDNIQIGLSDLAENFSPLNAINLVRPLGDLAAAWVFTDTQRIDRSERVKLHTYGYEIIDCPRMFFESDHTKDVVDSVITRKIFWIITYCPYITTVVLATADHDFLPCLALLKNHGKEVVLMTARRYRGTLLQQQADQVLVIKPESGEELKVLDKNFGPDDYEHPDETIHDFILLMAYLVNQMDRTIKINQANVDFKALKTLLFELEDFPERLSLPVLEKILTFFRRQGVLKKIVYGRSHKTFYRLNYSHPFYFWSQKQQLPQT